MKLHSMLLVAIVITLLTACAPVQPVPQAQPGNDETVTATDDHEHTEDHESEHTAALADELGKVNFSISCTPEAQAEFNHGMAYQHTFWFEPAIESFDKVAELDPSCAMAYWGKALSMMNIPWSPMPEAALEPGLAVVEQALALGASTEREQAYIEAIATMYQDPETRDHRTRTLAYAAALEQLAQTYPDDIEAQIAYALALIMTADPTDKEFTNLRKASAILEPFFVEYPEHPGVAHYLIHSYDHPTLANQGLDAAQRFAAIAPSAPHALHMPSHIFSRLGYWDESIAANRVGVEVAIGNLPEGAGPTTSNESALHAMDYMMYAYLQRGQDDAAKELLEEINALEELVGAGFGAAHALAAAPTRYILERGQWSEAATLALPQANLAWERFPHAEAILVFGRALSAARAGDVEAAQHDLDHLQVLREAMLAINQGYWVGQADIQSQKVSAWIALAEGRNEEALNLMREAVNLESLTDKHPVTPGPLAPAHELLGEMLLELEQPEEALAAFEASLVTEPNRFRSLYGAARAAELAGETETARENYEMLIALAADADGERAGIAEAKAFLAE